MLCDGKPNPSVSDLERVKRIGRYLVGMLRAECLFRWQQSGEREADADEGGDKVTRRSVAGGVIMSGGHCLKVWTKKQQVVSLSTADSELYASVKTASEGLGIQSVAKDLGIACGLSLHLDATATMCLVNRRGLGKAEHVDMQNLWVQEATKSKKVRHEEDVFEREPRRLDDETTTGTKDRTAWSVKGYIARNWGAHSNVQSEV